MDVSVVICTYNRSGKLQVALNSILAQNLPAHTSWEIIIVDNNSTDATKSIVGQLVKAHPNRVKYVFEPQQGKSNALNTGIHYSSARYVVFTDDDVIADPRWLAALIEAFADHDCAGVGGRIVPHWTQEKPKWYVGDGPYRIGQAIVNYDLGSDICYVNDRLPLGANMAFKRETFDKHGLFRVDLGPRPGNEIRGEDAEFCARILNSGERMLYCPMAVISHPVESGRAKKSYCRTWYFDEGKASVLRTGIPDGPSWFGVPRYMFRQLITHAVIMFLSVESRARFWHELWCWKVLGEIVQVRQNQGPLEERCSDRTV